MATLRPISGGFSLQYLPGLRLFDPPSKVDPAPSPWRASNRRSASFGGLLGDASVTGDSARTAGHAVAPMVSERLRVEAAHAGSGAQPRQALRRWISAGVNSILPLAEQQERGEYL